MPQPIAAIVGNIFVEGWGKPSPYGTYVAYLNFFYKPGVVRSKLLATGFILWKH